MLKSFALSDCPEDPWILLETSLSEKRIHGSSGHSKIHTNSRLFDFSVFLEDPWILFLTTMSPKRIHGSSSPHKNAFFFFGFWR